MLLMAFTTFVFAGVYFWGVEVPGKIADVKAEQANRYLIQYEYRSGRGTATGQAEFNFPDSAEAPFELKPGASVGVRVFPLVPRATSALAAERQSIWGLLFFLLFAGSIITFLSFAQYALWYGVLLQIWLVKHGTASEGQIVDIQFYAMPGWPWHDITVSFPHGQTTFSVTAARQDLDREPRRCALIYRPRLLGGVPVPGAEFGGSVTVLYDPARPSRAMAYEFSYFRC